MASAGMVLVAGACVGTTSREEFVDIVRQRGGGLTSELPLDAVDAVTARLGVDDLAVRHVTVTPSSETVVLEVRDPRAPENLDKYLVRGGDVASSEPVRVGAGDDLDADTFPVSGVAFDRLDAMVDEALAVFGQPDGYVGSLVVLRLGDGVVVQLSLESARASATARFTGAGELVEVNRT